jgi:putative oxidoreductase
MRCPDAANTNDSDMHLRSPLGTKPAQPETMSTKPSPDLTDIQSARIADLEAERDRWRREAEQASEQLARLTRQAATAPANRGRSDPIDQVFDPRAPVPPPTERGRFAVWLGKISIDTLRVCLGLIFLLFVLLKFFPEVSPAEDISRRTVDTLTFGLISGGTAGFLVALVEVTIGLCLATGKFLKFGLALLALAMLGIMSPLVLFPEDLFSGKYNAPTLLGQYVLKDFVLLAAAAVIIARELGKEQAR